MNIKALLRSVLMDPEIINLTGEKRVYFFSPALPILEDGTMHFAAATAPIPPYVQYSVYDEDGALWAEGTEVATNYYIQVDIFARGDYTALEEMIRSKMQAAGFARTSGADLFEKETRLYHKAMRFVFTTQT